MDQFLEDMYQTIKDSMDNSEVSQCFLVKLRYNLENHHYRWAFAEIYEYFRNGIYLGLTDEILNKFWDDYAN